MYLQTFNCLYLWNHLVCHLHGVFNKLKLKLYANNKCRKIKFDFFSTSDSFWLIASQIYHVRNKVKLSLFCLCDLHWLFWVLFHWNQSNQIYHLQVTIILHDCRNIIDTTLRERTVTKRHVRFSIFTVQTLIWFHLCDYYYF